MRSADLMSVFARRPGPGLTLLARRTQAFAEMSAGAAQVRAKDHPVELAAELKIEIRALRAAADRLEAALNGGAGG